MQHSDELISHISDLAERSFTRNIYTYSGFLNLAEQSSVHSCEKELKFAGIAFFGGQDGCERQMVRFGSPEILGYDEDFPICTLEIRPLSGKFSDELSHRDFLGAIMNLGIDRELIGDIIVRENTGYVFADEKMANYISENLVKVKHTAVSCTVCSKIPENAAPQFKEIDLVVSSNRCDAVVAKVFNLSRGKSQELFRSGNIFVNGRECENSSLELKDGSAVSVRGFGKFIFDGITGQTGKGRTRTRVRLYV
ncbi:MAG: hypothetical protein E7233_07240 [Lachnospiraceae bacterium]|nr:hypothetical protein [Lachnospiraceae bacterium]